MLRFSTDFHPAENHWMAMLRFFDAFWAIFLTLTKPFFGWVCSVLSIKAQRQQLAPGQPRPRNMSHQQLLSDFFNCLGLIKMGARSSDRVL